MGGVLSRRARCAPSTTSASRLEAGEPEIFAIIGESGSGKTTLARMILNMATPTTGTIRFRGADLATHPDRRERLAFMRQVQPIFQNPFEAFNPLKRVDRYLFVTAAALRRRSRDAPTIEASRRGAAAGRPVARRSQRPLPARAVGRPVAARRDRARADLQRPR